MNAAGCTDSKHNSCAAQSRCRHTKALAPEPDLLLWPAGSTLIVAILGSSIRTYRSWLLIPVALIYPLSILLVWFLDYVVHLDE